MNGLHHNLKNILEENNDKVVNAFFDLCVYSDSNNSRQLHTHTHSYVTTLTIILCVGTL